MKIITLLSRVIFIVFMYLLVQKEYYTFGIVLMVFILLVNLIIRRYPWSKAYYQSDLNFLNTKEKLEKHFDLPKELLLGKMEEVLQAAGFKILETDVEKGEIYAISTNSWRTLLSWTENIYVEVHEKGEESILKISSVTLFQMFDWGKNKNNLDRIMDEYEDSLTI